MNFKELKSYRKYVHSGMEISWKSVTDGYIFKNLYISKQVCQRRNSGIKCFELCISDKLRSIKTCNLYLKPG